MVSYKGLNTREEESNKERLNEVVFFIEGGLMQ